MKALKWIAVALGLAGSNVSGGAEPPAAPAMEHAVIVHFRYGSTDLKRLYALEDRLESVLKDARAGEYDGNEVAVDGSDGYLYLYGPDADRLFQVIKPVLEETDFMRRAEVTLRYGPAVDNVKRQVVLISPQGR